MRDMAGRFEVHAQTVEDEARRMWASAQNISGAGWSGMAEATSLDTMTVEDEARRMWASAQNISGAGWSGMAEATSLDTMAQMNQAFRNIVNMLHGVHPVQHVHDVAKRLIHLGHGV